MHSTMAKYANFFIDQVNGIGRRRLQAVKNPHKPTKDNHNSNKLSISIYEVGSY